MDVVTGRAFTHALVDFELPGPLALRFARIYSSKFAAEDAGLGFGWGHSFGWLVEVRRRGVRVWTEQGVAVDFPKLEVGAEVLGPWGWLLRRESSGFVLDADDGLLHHFSEHVAGERRYRLSAVVDRNGNRISLYYTSGRLSEVLDSAGRTLRVTSTPEGRIQALSVQNGVPQGPWIALGRYEYDAAGNLTRATDASGYSSHYEYDHGHRLTADTDRAGLCFHFVYDDDARCVESWGDYPGRPDPSLAASVPDKLADGVTRAKGIHHCRFDYTPGYTEVADSTQVRRFFGNAHGLLDKSVMGGAVMTASYRSDGHLLSRTDAMGATTTFERDARGRVLERVDPLGRKSTAERDEHGLITKLTDPAAGVTRIDRDARGNVVVFADALGAATGYRYDERGLVVEQHLPTGGKRSFDYDAQGNLVCVTEPNGALWRYTYDALGRRIARVDPLGAETRYSYSERGDLVTEHDAIGGVTRFVYDGEGHLTELVNPKGARTALGWGGYHRLCVRKDPNGHEVLLHYNREGELVEVHNELGELHELRYSTAGLLRREKTFDGRALHYRHDLEGRPVRIENGAKEVTELEYDLAGQLVARVLHDGSREDFAYDARGELVSAESPAGRFLFERDALGRIVREAEIVDGVEHWVEVAYDAAGDRIGRRTSLGHTEAVSRGLLGERTRTLLDGVEVLEHRADLFGRETARSLGAGGWLESSYDPLGRVARRRAGGVSTRGSTEAGSPAWVGPEAPGVSVDTAYRYDWDGELIESHDQARGKTEFRYDPVGQLLAMVPEKARGELFRYDPCGNIHESDPGAPARAYGPGNRLLRKGNTELTWDADGRLAEKRERDTATGQERRWRYDWNAAGLLERVATPDDLLVEFRYDPFARRLSKRVTKKAPLAARGELVSETRFVWDGDVLVHELRTAASDAGDPIVEERTYCFEDDGFEPRAHREAKWGDTGAAPARWYHYVNDPIGTPERLVDAFGNVACNFERKAWGELTAAPGAKASTPIRLQGQYWDEETGLAYNRWRYYEPGTGRFSSTDPIGLLGRINEFSSPPNWMSRVDPFGLAPEMGRAGVRLADEGGVTIVSHGTGDVDRPAHAHVRSAGQRDCRIGPNGKPMAGQRELTPQEAAVVQNHLPAIRKELRKVGRASARMETEGTLPGAQNTSKRMPS